MADNQFMLTIVSPDRMFYEGMVDMVEFNTTEGEVGIYAQHIPMTLIIKPGILTITEQEEIKEAALHAGFVQIAGDHVTILAEIVEWPNEIDYKRAEEARTRAESRLGLSSEEIDQLRAEAALQRAITRIRTSHS